MSELEETSIPVDREELGNLAPNMLRLEKESVDVTKEAGGQ
jgi:hypothetical protein